MQRKITYEEAMESVKRVFAAYPVPSYPMPEVQSNDLAGAIMAGMVKATRRKMGFTSDDAALCHRIAEAQGLLCPLCGERLNLSIPRRSCAVDGMPTIEHVLPRSKGGVHHRNRIVTHWACNNQKGNAMPNGCELLYLEVVNAVLHP